MNKYILVFALLLFCPAASFAVSGPVNIGLRGGPSTCFTVGEGSDIVRSYITPCIELDCTGWITPAIGLGLGVYRRKGNEGLDWYLPFQMNHSPLAYKVNGSDEYVTSSGDPGKLTYSEFGVVCDLMWNLARTFGPRCGNPRHDLSLYAGIGWNIVYDSILSPGKVFSAHYDDDAIAVIGLLNSLRLTGRLHLDLDARIYAHHSEYRTTDTALLTWVPVMTLGLSYDIIRK